MSTTTFPTHVLPVKELLSHIETHVHPLNRYLLTDSSLSKVKVLERNTVKMLTLNMCLVPVCFEPLIPAPFQAQRMQEFVLHYLQDYDILCLQ